MKASPEHQKPGVASPVRARALDHIVLIVAGIDRALNFYINELGLEPVRVEEWRKEEVFFPSVGIDEPTIIDLVALPRSGENVDHICLVVEPLELRRPQAPGRSRSSKGLCCVGVRVAAVNCGFPRDGQMARAGSSKPAATGKRLCRARARARSGRAAGFG